MAAPTGLGSESAPEPATPEAATAEPQAPEAQAPEPSGPESSAPEPQAPESQAPAVAESPEPAAGGSGGADLGWEPPAADPDPQAGQPRRGARLTIAVAVVVVLAAAAAAGALVVVTHGFRPKTIVSYQPPAIFRLHPGDCIDPAPDGLSATVMSCSSPHDAEVFATFSLAGSSWPGDAAAQQQAAAGCQDRIVSYLNPALLNAGLTQEFVYPDEAAWKAGVRTTVCEVSSSTGPLTGSVRS
jgi:hypothetical protein